MKIMYALVVVAVLSGLYLTFLAPAPVVAPEPVGEAAAEQTDSVDREVDQVTDGAVIDDIEDTNAPVAGGNDFGMEYPVPDEGAAPVSATGNVVTIDLEAYNFGYSEDLIRVRVGDTVVVNMSSTDGFHDFVVDQFAVASDRINTGERTSVTFVADRVGMYEFYCSVGSHRAEGMVGTLIVEES